MKNNEYYGCDNPEALSYLEFGSINLLKGKKDVWGYWQHQTAYDLYMFARYAKDLFGFQKYIEKRNYGVSELNKYIENSAHNKILDYILKYSAIVSSDNGGAVCESGSSLWGWIEEAIACDFTFNNGENVDKIKSNYYIGSDISEMMNKGAEAFHSDYKMDFTTKSTLDSTIDDISDRLVERLAVFYGLSVSIRYAVRKAEDLVKVADKSNLSVYNRLSLSLGKTVTNVYGTGKKVFIPSLDELRELLQERGYSAKYCTANMQREKDGNNTLRASVIISENKEKLEGFVEKYNDCIEKSKSVLSIEQGEWKDIRELK